MSSFICVFVFALCFVISVRQAIPALLVFVLVPDASPQDNLVDDDVGKKVDDEDGTTTTTTPEEDGTGTTTGSDTSIGIGIDIGHGRGSEVVEVSHKDKVAAVMLSGHWGGDS